MKLHWIKNKGFWIQVITDKKNQVDLKTLPPDFKKITKIKNGFNFVTFDFAEKEGVARSSMADICRMSNAVFNELLAEVRDYMGFLYKLNDTLAVLDLITTFATVTMSQDYVKPQFGENIFIKAGRHPILEQMVLDVTPNDCNMSDESRVHILTGANMSGKSTYLRQVVVLTVMAQIGCFVPAEMATVRICDRIFSRVSNRDCLESNSSTFMLEMQEISYILTNVTEKSMVILDELGRGTSVSEGTAVCWAVTEELLDVGSLVFLATHFTDMNRMSLLHPFVQSYHFQLASEQGRSVTTHQLVRGGLDVSRTKYGLDVARKTKFPLPESIIENAREHLRKLELRDPNKNINPVDVICAEHIVMLRQLVLQNLDGDELKTAVGNIRASFVSQTEDLPEEVWEDNDSEGGSQEGDQPASGSGPVRPRAGQVPSLHLSERSQPEASARPGRKDTNTTHLTDLSQENLNNHLPSERGGANNFSGFLNLSGLRSGKGLFDDIEGSQEDDNYNPGSFLSGPLFRPGADGSLGSEKVSQQKNLFSPFSLKDPFSPQSAPAKGDQAEGIDEDVTPSASEIDKALASVPPTSTGSDELEPEAIINPLEF